MKAMDRATIDFENFFTLHIDSILPTDEKYFNSAGKINGEGYKEFCLYMDEQLEKFSEHRQEKSTLARWAQRISGIITSVKSNLVMLHFGHKILFMVPTQIFQ